MQSKHASLISFLFVIGAHVGVLAAVMLSPSPPKPVEIVVPTIQGILVMAEPEEAPPPPPPEPPPPPPEKKPEPKPLPKPPPKAPPSERAVKAPEPEPPLPVEKPAEPKPVEPAPAAVVPPSSDAAELANRAPVYPKQSRRLREQGKVLFEILVTEKGIVGEIKLKRSSGHKRLDDAALQTIKHWKFIPANRNGKPIDYWYDYEFEFTLN